MKKDIHPEYREVVFLDTSCNAKFLTRSTIETRETIEYQGKTYPLSKIEISSASHPVYTGIKHIVDSEGNVEKFRRRFGMRAGGKPEKDKGTAK
ncbi:50S ribosomal protein L31 [Candidatus Glomeribacter gigasporarum BEG34]|uniref:Large ribosomal subunit protein bL31B n=1 Tax=Candidatus Glomeribacter gigasporarum BEG34 TaxID=1070319 RepID=G2JC09_9BURK|nr:type B 50S ribosomal protein L31 [Candidatus Glomeribacter gigasporarum]CCD30315.1 50S ribosomal protein L31 [Candidatus Glomeribacter gigasporarum BEG34]